MPFSGFDDFDDCLETMMDEEGHDRESAQNICGALQAEAKADHGDPDALFEALERGSGLIADVGVDLVSGVDVPAVDSKWTMLKADSDGHDYRVTTPVLLAKQDTDDADEERRISYAAAMIPREPDKEGDVVPTPTVERAAHDFLVQGGGVDTDHSLIDGDGEVVESWVLKEDRTFELPDGSTETYGAGTWMVGIKWAADPWERIKAGELTGLSIYGMAEHVPLERAATCSPGLAKQLDIPLANNAIVHLVYESRTAAQKASEEIGLDGAIHEHEFDGMTVFMPGSSHDAFVERYMELSARADQETEVSASLLPESAETAGTHKGDQSDLGDMGTEDNTDPPDETAAADDGDETTTAAKDETETTADGGEDPTVATVANAVDELADEVATLKDALPNATADADGGGSAGDLSTVIQEFVDRVEQIDDVEKNPEAIKDDLRGALRGETAKQDAMEAAAMLADQFDMGDGEDLIDMLEAAQGMDPMAIVEQLEGDGEETAAAADVDADTSTEDKAEHDDMDEDDEDDDSAMQQSAAKRVENAYLGKGGDSRQTAAKGIDADTDADGTGLPSYREAASDSDD